MAEPAIGLIIPIILFAVIFLLLTLFLAIFWIVMIIDCARRHFKDSTEKLIWLLVIILTGAIGAIVYYFVVRRPAKKISKR